MACLQKRVVLETKKLSLEIVCHYLCSNMYHTSISLPELNTFLIAQRVFIKYDGKRNVGAVKINYVPFAVTDAKFQSF